MNLRDWKLRGRALFSSKQVERELDDELSFHIERETQKLVDDGMSPVEARRTALKRFGPVPLAADECRDARGTALVDSTVKDVAYAIRSFFRTPIVSATIVVTVAVGLGVVTVLFSILNIFLFRVDHVPDIHEMFTVQRPDDANGERPNFTRPQFETMLRETNVFAGAYAEQNDIDTRIDGRMMSVTLVTGDAFRVFGVRAAAGRALLPTDDDRTAPNAVVVLSDRGWQRHFGRDPQIIGRKIIVNGAPHEVVGVMPEGFRGLSVSAPDVWAPMSSLADFRPIHRGREDQLGLAVIGRLKPGVSRGSALAQLDAWDSRGATERRAANILLVPRRGTVPQPLEALVVFAPLFFSFGLILLIGCANVANLLLARGVSRQREIGIRLSLGASRWRIVRQLLTESLVLALAAAALGFYVSRIAIHGTIAAVQANLPPDIGAFNLGVPEADWRVVLFLIAGAVLSTAFFGLMPALHATRIDPVRTLRGELIKDAKPGRSRSVLIGLQVAASALLLICSAVFLRSTYSSTTQDPGIRTSDTLVIEIINETRRAAMIQAISTDPTIVRAAAAWPDLMSRPRAAFAQAPDAKATLAYRMVSPEYFGVLDIPIVRGRGFADHERAGAASVILSETAARTLFATRDPIGQVIQLDQDPDSPTRRIDEPALPARAFTVVGISRDVTGFRIDDFKDDAVYVPIGAAARKTALVARANGDPEMARQRILEKLTLVDPNMGQVWTLRTMSRMEFYVLRIAFGVTLVLGALALTLTVSGLFSVLSYLVEQRTKEIGVRMALGATSRNVTRLVLSQTARPVAIGLLIGTASAAALATLLIALPAAGAVGEVVKVTDPFAYIGSLLLIVAACYAAASIPAGRAARVDPMRTLRQD